MYLHTYMLLGVPRERGPVTVKAGKLEKIGIVGKKGGAKILGQGGALVLTLPKSFSNRAICM